MAALPATLQVPEAYHDLLPASTLPITRLVDFRLPPQNVSTVYTDAEDYLSEEAPSVLEFDAKAIPAPASQVIKALGRLLLEDPHIMSIRLLHAPTYRGKEKLYPVWLVTLWAQAETVREVKGAWRRALEKLRETEHKSRNDTMVVDLVQRSIKLWMSLRGRGQSRASMTGYLVRWMTTDWLSMTHEHQMLELLQEDLKLGSSSADVVGNRQTAAPAPTAAQIFEVQFFERNLYLSMYRMHQHCHIVL
ncbi:hypothetical protein C8F01DRAFT_1275234 [Mycena amicta]|nr:hypothetical protein C8F01DRAFT_1275234 [Mycena amicta]